MWAARGNDRQRRSAGRALQAGPCEVAGRWHSYSRWEALFAAGGQGTADIRADRCPPEDSRARPRTAHYSSAARGLWRASGRATGAYRPVRSIRRDGDVHGARIFELEHADAARAHVEQQAREIGDACLLTLGIGGRLVVFVGKQ